MAVDVVADLFALVTEHPIGAALKVAFDKVAEEPVELYPAVVGTDRASTSQAAGPHAKVSSVLLHHDVGSNFGGPEDRVLALVDPE